MDLANPLKEGAFRRRLAGRRLDVRATREEGDEDEDAADGVPSYHVEPVRL